MDKNRQAQTMGIEISSADYRINSRGEWNMALWQRWTSTADHGGFKFITYVLTILWHIYNSLINMRSLHILPRI